MADNTTTTPTPQSNGVPLSALPALTAPVNGEELLLITKNNQSLKTTAAALKAYINAEMATLAGMQQAVKTVSDRIDALVNGDASSAIDTFNEIEAFLTGITDTETLTGLLAELKSTITAETDNKLNTKVDKVTGKGLSANDYTNDEKQKLDKLPSNEQFGKVGFYAITNGAFVVNSLYRTTGLIALNREYALTFYTYVASTASSVCFYDVTGAFISALQVDHIETTVAPEDFPANAALIALNTRDISVSNSYYHNGPTIESREGAISEAIQASMTAAVDEALIARAEACGVVYNRKTGYFSHNGIDDLTADEVSDMLAHVNEIFLPGARRLQMLKARTNIVTASTFTKGWNTDFVNLDGVCEGNQRIEVLKIGDCQVSKESQLICLGYQCGKLRKVIGVLDLSQVTRCRDTFRFVLNLEEVTLDSLRVSISFADCPLLTLSSLQYLVNNAANTEAITVTVHPTVYAKLTDESNAEWNAVLTAAEAKQIEFATTE